MKRIAGILMAMFVSAGLCLAGDTADAKIDVSGSFSMDQGQIIAGHFQFEPLKARQWLHRDYLNLKVQARVSDRLVVVVEPEIRLWFNTFSKVNSNSNVPFRQYSFVAIAEGQGIYSFFGNADPRLRFSAGFFPLKYNPDAADLGEYLFRSGTYPSYLRTNFAYPYGRLFGFHLSSTLFGRLTQDLVLHSEMQIMPLHDWSLTYLINASVNIFEAGAGASLFRWFPVVTGLTIPDADSRNNAYYKSDGTTGYYPFKGIKGILRFAVDPKRLFPAEVAGKFGKNDFRLYSEAAVLGLKDYPAYVKGTGADSSWRLDTANNFYADISQRIPIMAGFTFPTCGLFDFCSIEIERYDWRFSNSLYDQQFYSENAKPTTTKKFFTKEDYQYDTWKWSVKGKKTFSNGISLMGQIARDHMFHENYLEGDRDEVEALTRSHEWYWMTRIQFNF